MPLKFHHVKEERPNPRHRFGFSGGAEGGSPGDRARLEPRKNQPSRRGDQCYPVTPTFVLEVILPLGLELSEGQPKAVRGDSRFPGEPQPDLMGKAVLLA